MGLRIKNNEIIHIAMSNLQVLFTAERKEGMKEVATYIKKNWSCRYPVGSSGYDEWLAKLKEWGV